jgi:hypothetical protein
VGQMLLLMDENTIIKRNNKCTSVTCDACGVTPLNSIFCVLKSKKRKGGKELEEDEMIRGEGYNK